MNTAQAHIANLLVQARENLDVATKRLLAETEDVMTANRRGVRSINTVTRYAGDVDAAAARVTALIETAQAVGMTPEQIEDCTIGASYFVARED